MNVLADFTQLIDFRSFSSLWYWLLLGVFWFRQSAHTLGVPLDIVLRTKQGDAEAQSDMVDLARIRIERSLEGHGQISPLQMAVIGFASSILVVLALWYGVEFAQAVLLIVLPWAGLYWLEIQTAQRIMAANPAPERLEAMLYRHHANVQILAAAAVFISALWGMWINLGAPSWYI